MAYSERLIERAKRELSARKQRAEQQAASRRTELFSVCTELEELDRELSKAGLEAIKAIGMGADAQKFIEQLAQKNLQQQRRRKEILTQIGVEEDYLDVHYTCPKCEDKGTVGGCKCSCYKELLKKYAYEELCACSPVKLSDFESFRLDYYSGQPEAGGISVQEHMSHILGYCKTWAREFDKQAPSTLLYGATGLGKTHLSLAMAKAAIENGYGVVYGSAQNLLGKIEREKFGRAQDDEDTEQLVLECDLLILDDLGAEFLNSFSVSVLYNIINTRMMTGLPTIINTNLSFQEIEARYTERISSRIIGEYTPLKFIGTDIRQLKP